MSIEIVSVSKKFGSFTALDDITLSIPSGELTALLGPSGSGKTTLLRIIAGMENPDAGSVIFHGEDATNRHVRDRQVGFVFQHYALFRHMTVFDNIAFGLTVKPRKDRPSKSEIRDKVNNLLRLVQLEAMGDRYPSQLSGGQRQRVALARALAVEPKVLLLDEPFGALDAQVRIELRRWLRRLHDEIHVTSVFVTHDQEEALEVADRVVVMNKGKIEQEGTPSEVYDHPATPFIFDFLGNVNLFHGRVHKSHTHLESIKVETPELAQFPGASATGYVRSHDIDVQRVQMEKSAMPARVRHIQSVGPVVRVDLLLETGNAVEAALSRDVAEKLELKVGETVYAMPRKLKVFVDGGVANDYQI